MPQGNAQQPDAQSLALRHCPPMNCRPTPLPTFFSPAGSNAGPPTHLPASRVAGGVGGAFGGGGGVVPRLTKPHPSFPAWN
jgi:hypothetical protein